MKELKTTINEAWEKAYPGSVPVEDVHALCMRVRNLAEDRANWLFNARALQKQVNEMESQLHANHTIES